MRRFRLAWQSVVVIAAISLAAASTRMRGGVTFDQHQVSSNVIGTVGLVLLVIGAVTRVWLQLRQRDTHGRRRDASVGQLVARLAIFALILVAAYVYRRAYPHGVDLFGGGEGPDAAQHSPGTGSDTPIVSNGLWPIILLVATVVTLAVMLLVRRRRLVRRSDAEVETPLAALVERAARAGLSALTIHDGTRTAVIRCYESMADVIRQRGVRSTAADTPTDLLMRARRDGVLHDSSGAELIELFQLARYGSEPLPVEAADRAAAALRRIIADAGRTPAGADA